MTIECVTKINKIHPPLGSTGPLNDDIYGDKKTPVDDNSKDTKDEEDAVCWLLNDPTTGPVYLRDRSARTVVRATTLKQNWQIKLSISPSH